MSKTKEPVMLKIVDTFVKPFLAKDLNYALIREILKLKLILDKRRVPTINRSQPKKGISCKIKCPL